MLRTLRNVVSAGAAPEGSRRANGVGASVPGAECAALRARAGQVCEGRAGPAPAALGAPRRAPAMRRHQRYSSPVLGREGE